MLWTLHLRNSSKVIRKYNEQELVASSTLQELFPLEAMAQHPCYWIFSSSLAGASVCGRVRFPALCRIPQLSDARRHRLTYPGENLGSPVGPIPHLVLSGGAQWRELCESDERTDSCKLSTVSGCASQNMTEKQDVHIWRNFKPIGYLVILHSNLSFNNTVGCLSSGNLPVQQTHSRAREKVLATNASGWISQPLDCEARSQVSR